jgi:hypothetical protein
MSIKRTEYRGHRYWVDREGLAYRDLLHVIFRIASPSLTMLESERRYIASLLDTNSKRRKYYAGDNV